MNSFLVLFFFAFSLTAVANDSITINRRFVQFQTNDGHPITAIQLDRSIQIRKYQFKLDGGAAGELIPGSVGIPNLAGSRDYYYARMKNSVISPYSSDEAFLGETERDYFVLDRFTLKNSKKRGRDLYKYDFLKVSVSYYVHNASDFPVEFFTDVNGTIETCSKVLSTGSKKDLLSANNTLPSKIICKTDFNKKEFEQQYLDSILDHYLRRTRIAKYGLTSDKKLTREQLKNIVAGINNGKINIGSDIDRTRSFLDYAVDSVFGDQLYQRLLLGDKAAGLAYEKMAHDQKPMARLTINNNIVFEYNN
jgi:hypothetical protein